MASSSATGASDTAAVLTSRLPTFSGAAATIGDPAGSNGTLNVSAGTFNVTGSDAANLELIVGRNGSGGINVTGGADVNVAQDTALGENAGSIDSGDYDVWRAVLWPDNRHRLGCQYECRRSRAGVDGAADIRGRELLLAKSGLIKSTSYSLTHDTGRRTTVLLILAP